MSEETDYFTVIANLEKRGWKMINPAKEVNR